VLLLHGYGEHAGRYDRVARMLNQRALSVAAVDLRGHGRSQGKRGFVRRFADYHLDAAALLAATSERSSGGPLALFGHSMGALVACHWLLAAADLRFTSLTLTSPFFGIARAPGPLMLAVLSLASRFAPSLPLPSGLRGGELTHDCLIAREYDMDPLSFKAARARWITEALAAIRDVEADAWRIALPTLLLYSGADQVADEAGAERFAARLVSEKQVVRFPDLFHEILNEPPAQSDPIVARIGDWIIEHATGAEVRS
jgi:alpha-beta hydrolase superfamily lysophospholipase